MGDRSNIQEDVSNDFREKGDYDTLIDEEEKDSNKSTGEELSRENPPIDEIKSIKRFINEQRTILKDNMEKHDIMNLQIRGINDIENLITHLKNYKKEFTWEEANEEYTYPKFMFTMNTLDTETIQKKIKAIQQLHSIVTETVATFETGTSRYSILTQYRNF